MPVKTNDRELGLGGDAKDLGAKLREMISQEHWDYVDKILADHGVDPDVAGRRRRADGRRHGLGRACSGWTEATGAPQIDIALAAPDRAAGQRPRPAAARRPSTRPTPRA